MPKDIYELKDFSGGLVNNTDSRDLEPTMLAVCTNACVSKFGKIVLLGREVTHSISTENLLSSLSPGYGLYVFRSDFPYQTGSVNGMQVGSNQYNVLDNNSDTLNYIEMNSSWKVKDTAGGYIYVENNNTAIPGKIGNSLKASVSIEEHADCVLNRGIIEYVSTDEFKYKPDNSGFSSPTVGQDVNFIAGGSIISSDILQGEDIIPPPKIGSFVFLAIQSGHKFHIYEQFSNSTFIEAGTISKTQATDCKPFFIYIDNALRICDSNFNNELAISNPYEKDGYGPRWFGYLPKKRNFIKDEGIEGAGHIINNGWRDEANNVYDANYILSHQYDASITPDTANELFVVTKVDDDAAVEITDLDFVNPMKVKMKIGINDDDGDWDTNTLHKELKFGISYVYDNFPQQQESRLYKNTTALSHSDTASNDNSLNFELAVRNIGWPVRVTGISMYCWYMNEELVDPLWIGSLDFDIYGGWTGHDGTSIGWTEVGVGYSKITVDGDFRMRSLPAISYLARNGYLHDHESATFKYKAACVQNRYLYVGNVKQVGGEHHNKVNQDRMLKSGQNKFDVIPATNYVDVATNDGDEIIALVDIADKIMQFKRNTLYIINVSQVLVEYLDSEHKFKGITNPDAYTKFSEGVAWVNNHGCWIYDGNEVIDILEGKLDINFWVACIGKGAVSVGYMPSKKELIIYFENNPYRSPRIDALSFDSDGTTDTGGSSIGDVNGNCLIFNFNNQSWQFGDNLTTETVRSNMIDDFDNRLIFATGTGLYEESHSFSVEQSLNLGSFATGSIKIKTQGSAWNSTYNRLYFYHDNTNAWVELGYLTAINTNDVAVDLNDAMIQALMADIEHVINTYNENNDALDAIRWDVTNTIYLPDWDHDPT